MKIAVPYENGEIFGHFGHTKQFKVYDPDAKCDHHDHEHGEGHTCGERGCGGNCHGQT